MNTTVAQVFRGEIVDLTHQAHVAVVDISGKLLYSVGDPSRVSFIRSCAKPFQALVACESGAVDAYGLDETEIALLCGSHNGEPLHVNTARSILEKAGLDESFLQCGMHPSLNPAVAKTQPQTLSPAYSNCSGKHAGMLIGVHYLEENLEGYLEVSHPVQQRILAVLADMTGVSASKILLATDGCGVPVHAMPLQAFAVAMARLGKPDDESPARAAFLARIGNAMCQEPFMVAGSDRLCTRLMEEAKGSIVAKLGADGYYAVSVPAKGLGITCKVEDGNVAIVEGLILHVLRQLELLTPEAFDALEAFHSPKRTNHRGDVVGHVKYAVALKDHRG
jgi:L-asparaginase II